METSAIMKLFVPIRISLRSSYGSDYFLQMFAFIHRYVSDTTTGVLHLVVTIGNWLMLSTVIHVSKVHPYTCEPAIPIFPGNVPTHVQF